MTDRPSLTLTFLGGAESIGASCAVLEVGPATIVIDCGVRFNSPSPLPDLAMLQDKPVDAVFVTHAHSDHTGGLPVLAEAFGAAPVYAAEPTKSTATGDD